jgi:hypothetical protein
LRNGVSQPVAITVKVPARLHLGFLDLNGGLGRRFGGIGLAVSDLGTSLTIQRTKFSEVTGPETDRVRPHLKTMERLLALHNGHGVKNARGDRTGRFPHGLAWQDDTEAAKAWFAELRASGPPPSPNLGVVMGRDFAQIAANLGRDLMEGRLGILTAVFEAAATKT